MSELSGARKNWPVAALGIAATLALVLHARHFLPFISDDALISLRYSDRLISGHGLTWTDGPRVEGYTNLLWVLSCAALGAIGMDLIDAARLLGCVGMSAALWAVGWSARPRRLGESSGTFAGVAILAAMPAMAVWAIGGLEQPLVAAFWAWALVLVLDRVDSGRVRFVDALPPGVLLGMLCITRADSAVLCVGLALGVLLGRRFDRQGIQFIVGLAVFPILLGGGQLIFRKLYYGEWVPNSALVKVAFTSKRVADGWDYFASGSRHMAGLMIAGFAAIIVFLARRESRARAHILLASIIVWAAYVVFIGGDIFPARRHFVPILVPLALLVAMFCRDLAGRSPIWAMGSWVLAVVIAAAAGVGQWRDPATRGALTERWEWDGKAVADLLRGAFGDKQPLLACDAAGCLPYFSRLPSIDMLGLNDYFIARKRTANFGKADLGHELGDGRYVMNRKPDIVIFSLPTGSQVASFVSGQEMMADPRFNELYRFAFMRPGPQGAIVAGAFFRVTSEKIGIQQQPGRIVVPGYFTATEPATGARLDSKGRFGAVTTPGEFARLGGVMLPRGVWDVGVESDEPVQIFVLTTDPPGVVTSGTGTATIRAEAERPVPMMVELRPNGSAEVHIREIVFAQRR